MNKLNIKSLLLLIPLLLLGCEKIIENFDFLESDPKLVINAPFIADSTIVLHVSNTVGIMEDDNFVFVEDARVELLSNGLLLSTATHIDSGYYTFNVIPQAGEDYFLKVYASGFPDVSADIKMPERTQILSKEFIGNDELGSKFHITIRDQAESNSYYGLSLTALDGYINFDTNGPIDTVITGFRMHEVSSQDIDVIGSIYNYQLSTNSWSDEFFGSKLVISDQYHNGASLAVDFRAYDIITAVRLGSPLTMVLETYDDDYISYMKSLELYFNSDGNPLAEKVTMFTNIEGGLGLVYGKTISKVDYTLTMSEF